MHAPQRISYNLPFSSFKCFIMFVLANSISSLSSLVCHFFLFLFFLTFVLFKGEALKRGGDCYFSDILLLLPDDNHSSGTSEYWLSPRLPLGTASLRTPYSLVDLASDDEEDGDGDVRDRPIPRQQVPIRELTRRLRNLTNSNLR